MARCLVFGTDAFDPVSHAKESVKMKVLTRLLIALVACSCNALCTESASLVNAISTTVPQDKKVMTQFRGVRLGMKRAEVTTALGKPSSSDEAREEYSFDGDNQITIHYDKGDVRAIQISFLSGKVPAWTEVVGDAEISQTETGAKTARKVLSAENCWVSMYQNKDGSVTRITISR
jgi:hypothetical protein